MNSGEHEQRIEDYIKKQNPLTVTIFIFILSTPIALSTFFFALADGYIPAENNVIGFSILLGAYLGLYLLIFFKKKLPPRWVFKLFMITDMENDVTAEKVAFNPDYIFKNGTTEIQLSPMDRKRLILLSNSIVKMKLVNRIGPALIIPTLLFIGFFGLGLN
jgi:hypothetical protein